MHFALTTHGLPGAGYHGGAVTCWAIVKAMLVAGHQVTVLSLFDNSPSNPYLTSRTEQTNELKDIGAHVEFVDFRYEELHQVSNDPANVISKIMSNVNNLLNPKLERFFAWANLSPLVRLKLEKIQPDAIFCYHFDALSAVYRTQVAPIMAGVGDLWHLPGYFRWLAKRPSLRKYAIDGLYQLANAIVSKKLMLEMLSSCGKPGAFAAHYAKWLQKQNGFSDTLYLRTPVHDPVGSAWSDLRKKHNPKDKPKILMIGDLATTSTSSGLREFTLETLPILEEEFRENDFEVHMVGGGFPPKEIAQKLNRPSVKLRDRIVSPDIEFLSSDMLLVPTPITLGIRVRIITAFSFGCPVVAHQANAAGIPELAHGKNVLLSNSGRGLAREVIHVLKDNQLKEKLEENGRLTYERYFSEKVAAGKIVEELERLAKSGRKQIVQ